MTSGLLMSIRANRIAVGMLIGIIALAFLPMLAFGQAQVPPHIEGDGLTADSIFDVLNTILTFVYGIFFFLAVLFILWAAFLYLTAGGDEEKTGKAKQTLIYAVIAIVVALLAFAIPMIVANFVGDAVA